MKLIYLTNKAATYITTALYLGIYTGMYAQVVLGFLQLAFATIITFLFYSRLDIKDKKTLKRYWLAVAFAPLLAFISLQVIKDGVLIIVSLFVYPMYIAWYFLFLTRSIYKHLNQITL